MAPFGSDIPVTRKLGDLPGPRGWPLVGNLLQMQPRSLHLTLEAWAKQYGPLYRILWGRREAIVIADAELNAQVLRARPNTIRRLGSFETLFSDIGSSGVFTAEGSAWRQQRALVMQALSPRNLRAFYPTLRSVADRLRGRLAGAADQGGGRKIQDDFMRFTVDVTTLLTFDIDLDTLRDGDHVLQRQLELIFPAIARRMIAPFPYWRWIRLPVDRRLERAMLELRRLQEGIVAERRARLEKQPEADRVARDFIEAMLLARDEQGRPFDDDVIYGNMLTMLVAGEDTTAQSLAWAVHYLCDHPDVVALARLEIDAALGDELTPPDLEAIAHLPYVDAIVHEAMRLRPVAPFMAHEALEDLVVADVAIPRGAYLCSLTRPQVLQPQHFHRPERFLPERWLAERPRNVVHKPGASIPFGFGPRICPGRSLALAEMRVVLATLLKNFDLKRVGRSEETRELFAFTMSPDQLRVELSPRA